MPSPTEHYRIAERLLDEWQDKEVAIGDSLATGTPAESVSREAAEADRLLQAAAVHAALAQATPVVTQMAKLRTVTTED